MNSGVFGHAADKGNHRHFMQKEIYEQPVVVAQKLTQVNQLVGGYGQHGLEISGIGQQRIAAKTILQKGEYIGKRHA